VPDGVVSPEEYESFGKAETDSGSEGKVSTLLKSRNPDHTAAAGIKNAMQRPKNAIKNLVRIFLTPFREILCGRIPGYAKEYRDTRLCKKYREGRICKKIPGGGFPHPGEGFAFACFLIGAAALAAWYPTGSPDRRMAG
jgi:hypothetical protein